MKKTLTVNLGGTVYSIDEDAYALLDNYLNNLHAHFRSEKGADEIVADMEARISELFDEYLRAGLKVITIKEAEEVIARMGKPEQWACANEDVQAGAQEKANGPVKKLFRNEDDRILGGVASGLAAYMGWDVTWVRLLLILLGFFVQGLIVAYIVCWIVIPAAKTATQKLQMRGEPINVENIGKTVTDGFDRVHSYMSSDQPRSLLARIGNVVVQIAGLAIKFVLVLVALCCAPVLLAVLVVFFALLLAGIGVGVSLPVAFCQVLPFVDWAAVGENSLLAVSLSVCGLLAVGIPVVGLLQLVLQSLRVWKPMATELKVLLMILWLVALAVGLVFLFQVPFVDHTSNFYWDF